MGDWDRAVKKYAEQEKKEGIIFLVIFILCMVGLVLIFIWVASNEPAYCRQMRELNPDWQFHYDQVTGCRVLFHDFWIPVDDMPDVLRGGE